MKKHLAAGGERFQILKVVILPSFLRAERRRPWTPARWVRRLGGNHARAIFSALVGHRRLLNAFSEELGHTLWRTEGGHRHTKRHLRRGESARR